MFHGGISRTICAVISLCSRRHFPYRLLMHLFVFQEVFLVPSAHAFHLVPGGIIRTICSCISPCTMRYFSSILFSKASFLATRSYLRRYISSASFAQFQKKAFS
jgi:hypothetical protein